MVSLIQDHDGHDGPSGVNADGGRSRITIRACWPAGSRARGPGHDGPGGRGGQVDDLRVPRRSGSSPAMIRGGAGQRLGGQLDLDGPDLPGVRAGVEAGPVDLGVGQVPGAGAGRPGGADAPLGVPPRPALAPGRGRPGATAGRPARRGCAPGAPAPGAWPGSRTRRQSCPPGSASTTPGRVPAARWRRTRPAATAP